MKPLISIIIPAYNCEKTIETAILSMLSQTYENTEIIVVDDKSTDKTKEIVERIAAKNPKVRMVDGFEDPHRFDRKLNRNVNAGYSARNTGFHHAKGTLITLQDADDASFLNRIEIQYGLLVKNNAIHVCVDWQHFNEKASNKKFDVNAFEKESALKEGRQMIGPDELYRLSQKTKGVVAKISTKINAIIPFHLRKLPILQRLFWGTLDPYPGTGNSPLFRREVIEKVNFRKLADRVWPSFMGRGADRDFNFQVAETFKNSYTFFIPLYLWRQSGKNERYTENLEKYIL